MKKQEIKKLSKDEMIKNIDKLKKDLFNSLIKPFFILFNFNYTLISIDLFTHRN